MLKIKNFFKTTFTSLNGFVKFVLILISALTLLYGLWFAVNNTRNGRSFLVNFIAGTIYGVYDTAGKAFSVVTSIGATTPDEE